MTYYVYIVSDEKLLGTDMMITYILYSTPLLLFINYLYYYY